MLICLYFYKNVSLYHYWCVWYVVMLNYEYEWMIIEWIELAKHCQWESLGSNWHILNGFLLLILILNIFKYQLLVEPQAKRKHFTGGKFAFANLLFQKLNRNHSIPFHGMAFDFPIWTFKSNYQPNQVCF